MEFNARHEYMKSIVAPQSVATASLRLVSYIPVFCFRIGKRKLASVLSALLALGWLSSPAGAVAITRVVPSAATVRVDWQGGAAPYQLQVSTNLKTWQDVDVETSGTSLTAIKTAPMQYFRVISGGNGNSEHKAPSVPAGLTATPFSSSQMSLSWAASTDSGGSGLKGYNIYRGGVFLKQVLVPATSSSDTGLTASTAYSYTILAVDNAGNASAQSAAVSATTPALADSTPPSVPTGLTATAPTCSQVN